MSPLRSLTGRPAYPFVAQQFEHQLEMVMPAPLLVDLPPIPPGYILRQLRAGEEKPYDDLFHLAFADDGRFLETLEQALG